MSVRFRVGFALLVTIAPAISWAQRPITYPMRSQTPSQQAIDQALCYAQAKKETNVDVARQPQTPTRSTPITFASDAGRGTSAPPLPGSTGVASAAAPNAAAPTAASGASAGMGASQSGTAASAASAAPMASAPGAASGPSIATGNASETKMPPLPPPEPPMTTYWRSWGNCMQSRGYGVQ
ncbi:hypothetical protein C9I57_31255 [Trinickia symbiotica]|uniref:Uncharacterized protein n=1 Tax=Trinickia symbiotica TaxID=863227 RepID=A0A2T3XK71_9BURK|nr:hypothetical protein C9I57_31255 [Trinickia symbiotica]